MKKLILMFLLVPLFAQAESLEERFCKNKSIKNPIYMTFLTSNTMKHKFTSLYRTLADKVGDSLREACSAGINFNEMVGNAKKTCISTCDNSSDYYIQNRFFGKKEQGQEIFNECAGVCHMMAASHFAYREGSEDAQKEIIDGCVNVKNTQVNTLSRNVQKVVKEAESKTRNARESVVK